jgi:hypothetical protein
MEIIRVPKPAPEAFHKNRRVSDLLMSQVAHFQHVAQKNALQIDPDVARDVHTEGGAARFIGTVTRLIHKGASPARGNVVPMRRAAEVAEGAPIRGTVHRIAAVAGSPTASKPKKQAKKAAKKSQKRTGARGSATTKAKQRKRS